MLNQPIKKCNHTETCIFQNSVIYSVVINVCRKETLGSPGQPAPAWAIHSLGPVTHWQPLRPWRFLTPDPRAPTLPAFLHPMTLEQSRIASQLALAIIWGILCPVLFASSLTTHRAPFSSSVSGECRVLAHCASSHPPRVLLLREWFPACVEQGTHVSPCL